MFYIMSLVERNIKKKNLYITFWRAEDAGYCWPLKWAGKYTEAQINESPDYYHNNESTLAVPCDVVDKLGIAPKKGHIDGDVGPVISLQHLEALKAAAIYLRAPVKRNFGRAA